MQIKYQTPMITEKHETSPRWYNSPQESVYIYRCLKLYDENKNRETHPQVYSDVFSAYIT